MKKLIILSLLLIVAAGTLVAQSPTPTPINAPIQNLYALGGSYNFSASPKFSGTALYGHLVVSPGTYFFGVMDIVQTTVKPYIITNNVGVGLAQKIVTMGKVSLIVPTTAGVSWTGSNAGWQWTGGLAFVIRLNSNLYLIPTARYLQSNVSNGSGTQPIIGVEFGFGK